jgi:N-acetylglucosamine-6-sulfatase
MAVALAAAFAVVLPAAHAEDYRYIKNLNMEAKERQDTLNILWIVDDDHPPYMMEPMPFTRRFIRDAGLNFGEGHADIPLCGPARVSLLTGMSVNTHKVNVNATWNRFLASPLNRNNRTIAKYLYDSGYVTGHFGKYINGHAQDIEVPPGWSRWVETVGDGQDEPWVNIDGEVVNLEENPSIYAAEQCSDFINQNNGRQWFAHYCPTIPHRPYTPEPEYEHTYDADRRDVPSTNEDNTGGKPGWMRRLDPVTGHQSEFEGKKEELRGLDQKAIKLIVETLEATGQLENTVIFFVSDNGYLHAEHRLMRKDRPYWESVQVPFFVKGPSHMAGGITSPAFVNHLDLFPTTLELAGLSVHPQADGRSLMPFLRTDSSLTWRKRMLATGSSTVGPNPGGAKEPSGHWWLLREGPKALILRENGFRELYWMEADPYQLSSKADQADQAMVNRMVDYVVAIRNASGDERRRLEEE